MSAEKELKLDISVMRLRCTVDTRDKSEEEKFSCKFWFKGGEWRLSYLYYPLDECQYNLLLNSCDGVSTNPLHVSVQVDCAEKDRIVLSEERRFTDEFEDDEQFIWKKSEREILAALPEFRLSGVLKFVVVLEAEETNSYYTYSYCFAELTWTTEALQAESPTPISSTNPPQWCKDPCFDSLSEDLAKLLDKDSSPDLEFECGGQTIGAHRVIVCARSPVIASMMGSDMIEGRTGKVKIPDMEPDVFRLFLRYMYTGQLPQLTVDLALSLYETADQYDVQCLAKRCSRFLVRRLTAQNAYHILTVADAHSAKDFKEAVIHFVLQEKILTLSGKHWDDFFRDHLDLANEVLSRICQKQLKMQNASNAKSKIPSRQQPIRRSVTRSLKRRADEI